MNDLVNRSPHHVRDHYLPPDQDAFRQAEPSTGRIIVIAPTRAACETIELAMRLRIETLLQREHGDEITRLAREGVGFGVVAGTGTGKTLAIRPVAEEMLQSPLRVGVVNREREATPETPTWNVVIVTTGIARRWFQSDLIALRDTIVIDEIHQTSAELELCLALGKRVGCRFIWLSATVDPEFYRRYLSSQYVLHTTAFDPAKAATVRTLLQKPLQFLNSRYLHEAVAERRGVAIFLPTRAEVEQVAEVVKERNPMMEVAFYHGGEPIEVIRPFLDGSASKPFLLAMTAAGQSALNIGGLDTVVIYDAQYRNLVDRGRNVLTRLHLGSNEILQMAGRVHGRVDNGEVVILTDRDVDFGSLVPTPPEFQLAGDSERVALTAAALGIDLSDLQLPVPLDRADYARAMRNLIARGIIDDGRLTSYGRDVEAMPVDRPWGELLALMEDNMAPFVPVMANVDSLHRMTRDESDLGGLIVDGSDHLTAYNLFAEAVNRHGSVGRVFGLPRHLFDDTLAEWADERGVLVKAIEDIALGTASVYRTLEMTLPERLPMANSKVLRRFRELLAKVMPLDLVIDEETAWGQPVRISRGSMCRSWGAVAGTIRYFADANGVSRGAIEGTNIPLTAIKRHARREPPMVEYRTRRGGEELVAVRRTSYFGFELDRERTVLPDPFPAEFAKECRDALTEALMLGETHHPDQGHVQRAVNKLGEYWRRSAGTLADADPNALRARLRQALESVGSLWEFNEVTLRIDVADLIAASDRDRLDALPSSTSIRGDKAPLVYELEDDIGIVRLRLREGQARRLREDDLPSVDRPLRFTVLRGQRKAIRAQSLRELKELLVDPPVKERGRRKRFSRRRRR
jgi:ATP-dependent RNA helicase HrpA